MTLSSIVSRDWQEVSVLECILGGLQIDVSVENEPKSPGSAFQVKNRRPDRRTATLGKHPALAPTAIPGKEVQGRCLCRSWGDRTRWTASVKRARCLPSRNQSRANRRSGRYRPRAARSSTANCSTGLEVPVSIKCTGQKPSDAHLVNMSQGGSQLRITDPIDTAVPVEIGSSGTEPSGD